MKKSIELHKKTVEYILKVSPRARRLRLAIYCDGNFVVTAPQNLSERRIEKFIIQKAPWVLDKLEHFKKFPSPAFIKGTKKDYETYKKMALALARKKIAQFNQIYGFYFNKISIRNQKTRWGSCSRKGNLNFNYKIARLPEKLADYIIVHELCHLKELNHSRRFWELVARSRLDYLQSRKLLRKGGIC